MLPKVEMFFLEQGILERDYQGRCPQCGRAFTKGPVVQTIPVPGKPVVQFANIPIYACSGRDWNHMVAEIPSEYMDLICPLPS